MKGQPPDSRRADPGTLYWGAEHSLLSSSGVTRKEAVSTSEQERKQGMCGGGGLDMGESCPNFFPDSKRELRTCLPCQPPQAPL